VFELNLERGAMVVARQRKQFGRFNAILDTGVRSLIPKATLYEQRVILHIVPGTPGSGANTAPMF